MKRFLSIIVGTCAGFAIAWSIASRQEATRFARVLQEKENAWQQEKALLTAELDAARAKSSVSKNYIPPRPQAIEASKSQTPEEIIALLKTLRLTSKDPKNVRLAIQQLENLIGLGESALPEIQKFLATQTDIEYDPSIFGSWKISKSGFFPIDFTFPPSLRFGLFDAARRIGGAQAEKLLAETLRITGRGVEVSYLTRVLQEMTPFTYRETALTVAKELLNNPSAPSGGSVLDKYERNYLFGVLAFYKDASLTQQAQNQLVQTDGKIDLGALQYLKETLGPQSVASAAQLYQDPRLADGQQKEPLARLALNFAGADEQANALYQAAIKDPALKPDSRRELIEDLNQDGFDNLKNFTEHDVQLIKNRLDLIGKYRQENDPKIIADAFNEAEKDLKNMLARATQPPTP